MTKPELLRKFLWQNGFYIKEEKAVICENKIYSVMNVYYSGDMYIPNIKEIYFGKIDFQNDIYAETYKKSVIKKLSSQYNGVLKSKNKDNAIALKNLLDALN